MKSWEPDQIFERIDFPSSAKKGAPDQKQEKEKPKQNQNEKRDLDAAKSSAPSWVSARVDRSRENVIAARKVDPPSAKDQPSTAVTFDPIFEAGFFKFAAASLHTVRHYLWKKESGKVYIYVVLKSLSVDAAKTFLKEMTSKEQHEMIETLRTPPTLSIEEVHAIRREFMEKISRE